MTITILLLGETGNGKSQLGNFLLMNPIAFLVSNDPDSCTNDIQESYGRNNKLFVIDTPGFEDTYGNDQKNIDKIVEHIRKKNLNAIIILFNFHQPRLSLHLKEILINIFKIFPQKNFFEHVGFVFSKSYSYYLKENIDEKLEKINFINKDVINFLLKAKNEIPEINIISNKKFPIFFIDSNLKNNDFNSKEEANRLIAWASSLNSLKNSEIKNVTLKIKKRIPEYRNIKLDSHFDKNIEYIKYSKQMRYKEYKYFSNRYTFTPWQEIKQYEEKIVHPREKINETYTKKTEFENKRKVGNYEYYDLVIYKSKKEYFNDGSVENGPWIKESVQKKKNYIPPTYLYSTYETKEYLKSCMKYYRHWTTKELVFWLLVPIYETNYHSEVDRIEEQYEVYKTEIKHYSDGSTMRGPQQFDRIRTNIIRY